MASLPKSKEGIKPGDVVKLAQQISTKTFRDVQTPKWDKSTSQIKYILKGEHTTKQLYFMIKTVITASSYDKRVRRPIWDLQLGHV